MMPIVPSNVPVGIREQGKKIKIKIFGVHFFTNKKNK
jgi:hypothetical protein